MLGPLLCDLEPSQLRFMAPAVLKSSLMAMASCQHIPPRHRAELVQLLYETFGWGRFPLDTLCCGNRVGDGFFSLCPAGIHWAGRLRLWKIWVLFSLWMTAPTLLYPIKWVNPVSLTTPRNRTQYLSVSSIT